MASTNDNVRSADIEFLFEALNYAATPLTINVALMGAAKDAKPNTLSKRITTLAKRYNLNITSTTEGECGSVPATPSKPKEAGAKTPASRKRKTPAKVKQESDEEENVLEPAGGGSGDEGDRAGKKQKMSSGENAVVDAGDTEELA